MKNCFKYFIILIFIYLGLKVELKAQPSFSIDSSFTPFLDFTMFVGYGGGDVSDIWENPLNENIYVVGAFNRSFNGKKYYGNVCYTKNGLLCPNYNGAFGLNLLKIFPINDSILVVTKPDFLLHVDFNGNFKNTSYQSNLRKSVPCKFGYNPYFFKDGSALLANTLGNIPEKCFPIYMGDTFPHQYLIKVDPQGNYDSTFNHVLSYIPTGFLTYDSNQILIYGLPRKFTMYDGITINGLCRTDLNGNIDTTFKSIFNPGNGGFDQILVQKDGKILIAGSFQLKDYLSQWFSIVRLNKNGSLDTTFMNFEGPKDSTLINGANVASMSRTADNGYLVSGYFNQYQGYSKNGIAKIDSTGKIEPQYFTSIGPDSSITPTGIPGVSKIISSVNGGYYMVGNWKYWDGKPSQPIIKIHGLSVGLNEKKNNEKTKLLNIVYPNPTNAILNLKWLPNQNTNKPYIYQIQILDLQGRVIKQIDNKVNLINIENIENGIYFLKVFGEDGNEVKKIIKQ